MDNLYYRPTVRTSRRNFSKKSRYFKFVFPILTILVVIALIFGLLRLWNLISSLKGTSLNSSAIVYIAEGFDVQKQTYGSTQFLPALSGEILLEGDSIRTLQGSTVVLEFFNDLVVRLDEGSTLTVEKIESKRNEESIELNLSSGQLWLNKPESVKSSSNLVVTTNYLKASTIGTIFAVKAGLPEYVAVSDGAVLVDVVDVTTGATIDQVNVASGQQMTLDNNAYESFQRRETPRVLGDTMPVLANSNWFAWNMAEDESPSNFSVDAALRTSNNSYIDQIDESLLLNEEGEVDVENDTRPRPVVTFPVTGDVVTTDTVEIIGTVPADTQAVVVMSFESGTASPYVLRGFKAGDSNFRYIAKYEADGTGNLLLGENKFEVRSVDLNGVESSPAVVEFTVELDGVTADSTEADDETPSTVDISNLEFSDDLEAPVLVSVNDEQVASGYVLKEPRAVLVGSIGKWAKSVVVNGYKLQQYEPYSGTFSYILSPGFNTLKQGENTVVAYGFDDENRRGKPLTITIVYQP